MTTGWRTCCYKCAERDECVDACSRPRRCRSMKSAKKLGCEPVDCFVARGNPKKEQKP